MVPLLKKGIYILNGVPDTFPTLYQDSPWPYPVGLPPIAYASGTVVPHNGEIPWCEHLLMCRRSWPRNPWESL